MLRFCLLHQVTRTSVDNTPIFFVCSVQLWLKLGSRWLIRKFNSFTSVLTQLTSWVWQIRVTETQLQIEVLTKLYSFYSRGRPCGIDVLRKWCWCAKFNLFSIKISINALLIFFPSPFEMCWLKNVSTWNAFDYGRKLLNLLKNIIEYSRSSGIFQICRFAVRDGQTSLTLLLFFTCERNTVTSLGYHLEIDEYLISISFQYCPTGFGSCIKNRKKLDFRYNFHTVCLLYFTFLFLFL